MLTYDNGAHLIKIKERLVERQEIDQNWCSCMNLGAQSYHKTRRGPLGLHGLDRQPFDNGFREICNATSRAARK